jgi:hypothetical protein
MILIEEYLVINKNSRVSLDATPAESVQIKLIGVKNEQKESTLENRKKQGAVL